MHAHEVEKAVALWRGRALLSLVEGGRGRGVGGGRRGYVNGAAVRAAEGFEWRWCWCKGWGTPGSQVLR